jgi:hypothetical protein
MHAGTAPLFDISQSALCLRVAPGADSGAAFPPTLLPNTMRANDLSSRLHGGHQPSTFATYVSDREPSTWTR